MCYRWKPLGKSLLLVGQTSRCQAPECRRHRAGVSLWAMWAEPSPSRRCVLPLRLSAGSQPRPSPLPELGSHPRGQARHHHQPLTFSGRPGTGRRCWCYHHSHYPGGDAGLERETRTRSQGWSFRCPMPPHPHPNSVMWPKIGAEERVVEEVGGRPVCPLSVPAQQPALFSPVFPASLPASTRGHTRLLPGAARQPFPCRAQARALDLVLSPGLRELAMGLRRSPHSLASLFSSSEAQEHKCLPSGSGKTLREIFKKFHLGTVGFGVIINKSYHLSWA